MASTYLDCNFDAGVFDELIVVLVFFTIVAA